MEGTMYAVQYALAWLVPILTFSAGIVCLVFSVSLSAPYSVAGVLVLPLFATTLLLRSTGRRVRVRAGKLFFSFTDVVCRARNDEDAAEKIMDAVDSSGVLMPVGRGWGFFLRARVAQQRFLFMHEYRGLLDNTGMHWKAGTSLREVADYLSSKGLAFDSCPSFFDVSIGSAYAQGGHGNGGDLNGGFSGSMLHAFVLDMDSGTTLVMDRRELRRRFDDRSSSSSFVVLSVVLNLKKLVSNHYVQKKLVVVDSPSSAAEFLSPGAYLRVLFVGRTRPFGVGAVWTGVRGPEDSSWPDHEDPHACSTFCTSLQLDVCSSIGRGYMEDKEKWTGKARRRHANQLSPDPLVFVPLPYSLLLFSGTMNFEVCFTIPGGMTPERLWNLLEMLMEMHKETGGRTEVRVGKINSGAPVFLDFSLSQGMKQPFLLLFKYGVREVALHPGKRQVAVIPCTLKKWGQVWGLY